MITVKPLCFTFHVQAKCTTPRSSRMRIQRSHLESKGIHLKEEELQHELGSPSLLIANKEYAPELSLLFRSKTFSSTMNIQSDSQLLHSQRLQMCKRGGTNIHLSLLEEYDTYHQFWSTQWIWNQMRSFGLSFCAFWWNARITVQMNQQTSNRIKGMSMVHTHTMIRGLLTCSNILSFCIHILSFDTALWLIPKAFQSVCNACCQFLNHS